MKLLKVPDVVISINIKKKGMKPEHLTVHDTTQEKTIEYIKEVIKEQNLEPFLSGNSTQVEVRIREKSINSESRSFSFRGLDPEPLKKLIIKSLEDGI